MLLKRVLDYSSPVRILTMSARSPTMFLSTLDIPVTESSQTEKTSTKLENETSIPCPENKRNKAEENKSSSNLNKSGYRGIKSGSLSSSFYIKNESENAFINTTDTTETGDKVYLFHDQETSIIFEKKHSNLDDSNLTGQSNVTQIYESKNHDESSACVNANIYSWKPILKERAVLPTELLDKVTRIIETAYENDEPITFNKVKERSEHFRNPINSILNIQSLHIPGNKFKHPHKETQKIYVSKCFVEKSLLVSKFQGVISKDSYEKHMQTESGFSEQLKALDHVSRRTEKPALYSKRYVLENKKPKASCDTNKLVKQKGKGSSVRKNKGKTKTADGQECQASKSTVSVHAHDKEAGTEGRDSKRQVKNEATNVKTQSESLSNKRSGQKTDNKTKIQNTKYSDSAKTKPKDQVSSNGRTKDGKPESNEISTKKNNNENRPYCSSEETTCKSSKTNTVEKMKDTAPESVKSKHKTKKNKKVDTEKDCLTLCSIASVFDGNLIKKYEASKRRDRRWNRAHGEQSGNRERRKPPNYFVSIQVTNPEVAKQFEIVQKAMCEANRYLEDAMIKIPTIHLTMRVARIETEEHMSRMKMALDESIELFNKENDQMMVLDIQNIGSFGKSVVFANVASDQSMEKVRRLAEILEDCCQRHQAPEHDRKDFNPHITIAKLSFGQNRRVKGIDSSTYAAYKTHNFGKQLVTCLQLCSMMKPKDKSGYYHVDHVSPAIEYRKYSTLSSADYSVTDFAHFLVTHVTSVITETICEMYEKGETLNR